MQLHLLNFHRFLANFAESLISTFIPLIIYKITNSITLAVGYIVIMCSFRALITLCLKNLYLKKPELMMLIRVIPFVAYNICLLFIENNFWFFTILVAAFYAFSISIKNCCHDSVLIYSTKAVSNQKGVAINRVVNYISTIISTLLGGLFLGFNFTAVILISSGMYVFSVIPLFVLYLKNKNNFDFNRDYTTNAEIYYNKNNIQVFSFKKLAKDIVLMNFVLTILYGATNYVLTLYNLNLFIKSSSFVIAGYIAAIVNLAKIIATILGVFLTRRFDSPDIAKITCLVLALVVPCFIFVGNVWIACVLLAIYCFCSELLGYINFLNINNSKLIGKSSEANMYGRQMGAIVGQTFTTLPAVLTGTIFSSFICASIVLLFGCFYWPIKSEKVRKGLVNYFNNNNFD